MGDTDRASGAQAEGAAGAALPFLTREQRERTRSAFVECVMLALTRLASQGAYDTQIDEFLEGRRVHLDLDADLLPMDTVFARALLGLPVTEEIKRRCS